MSALRLGTRGSALALAQARSVAERLSGEVEIVEIATAGDLRRDHPAGLGPPAVDLRRDHPAALGPPAGDLQPGPAASSRDLRAGAPRDKSRWTGALERALLDGEIDIAVHSAKDVPGELAAGTAIVAVPPREDARDLLVGARSLDALARGARVGTSALRRRAQLLAVRPDLDVVELRGNVDTRLRKLADGEVDALVLAAAGLARLGRGDVAVAPLEGDVFVPAPGQGCLLVQGRAGTRLDSVDDRAARTALADERHVVARLDATCRTPVGVHRRNGGMVAFVGLPDGTEWLIDAAPTAAALAERMLTTGAADLLARAEAMA